MRALAILATIAIIAGCGDSTGPRVFEPAELRVVIIRGDGQVSPVAPGKPAGAAQFALYATTPDPSTVLPDTLVAQITGPVGVQGLLPSNTMAHFAATEEGCGRAWIPSAIPDAEGYVRTLWELPGKLPLVKRFEEGWGYPCEMQLRVMVGEQFVRDTTFRAFFTPGPPRHHLFLAGNVLGGSELQHFAVRDAHQNMIPFEYRVDCDCAEAVGTIASYPSPLPKVVPVAPGEGRLHVVVLGGDTLATARLIVSEIPGTDRLNIEAHF